MRAGNLVSNPMNGSDYHTLLLVEPDLGGGADSKLFMNLPWKQRLAGSYSNIGNGRWRSFHSAGCCRTDKVDGADSWTRKRDLNMRDGKITEELNTAKAVFNGTFPLRGRPRFGNLRIEYPHQQPAKRFFYRTFLQKLNAVTIRIFSVYPKNYLQWRAMHRDRDRCQWFQKVLPNLAPPWLPIRKYDKFAEPVVEKKPRM